MISIAANWGTTPAERETPFPCDKLINEGYNCVLYRGITINAPAAIIYKWLCQIRVAPYSYDWIDNRGRRSPRALTPGLDDLTIGMPIQDLFMVVDFERDRSITMRAIQQNTGWMGASDCVTTCMIVPQSDSECRLLCKLAIKFRRNLFGQVMHCMLPWGDLIMMRKQFLTFKALAEKTAAEEV